MNTPTDTNAEAISNETDEGTSAHGGPLPLRRPVGGRMLAGVAAGVADYLGVDVMIVRIVVAVLAIVGGGAGILLYLAGWLLIPEEGSDQSLAAELIGSVSARSR